VVRHLKAYIHKHSTRSIITQVQFFKQKLQTFLQFFMDQNYKSFIMQFFVDQNCKPFIEQFFCGPKLQKLQTLHSAIFLEKIVNFPMTHNYPSSLYTQETYWVVVTTPKPILYFYNTFLLLSSSHYSMWDFGEYSLENQHILPSSKVSYVVEQTFDTPPIYMLKPLLLLVIQHVCLNHSCHWWSARTHWQWQSLPIIDPHRLAHQTRRQLSHQTRRQLSHQTRRQLSHHCH